MVFLRACHTHETFKNKLLCIIKNTYNKLEHTRLVASGSFLGGTLKWCTLPSKHVRVKRQLSLARVCKELKWVSKKYDPSHNTCRHCSPQWLNEGNYQTLSVREGFTALSSHIGSCIWPSYQWETQREAEVISQKNFLLQAAVFMNKMYDRFRPTAFMFFHIQHLQDRNAPHFHSPTLLTAVLLSDSRRDSAYCFGYQDRTPSWRTIQNERQPKNLELWWRQREESRIFIFILALLMCIFHFSSHITWLVCIF